MGYGYTRSAARPGELYRRGVCAVGKRRVPAAASGVGGRPGVGAGIHVQPLFITYAITARHERMNGIGRPANLVEGDAPREGGSLSLSLSSDGKKKENS